MTRLQITTAVAALMALAACGRKPQLGTVAPQSAADAQIRQRAADSAAARAATARRDSLAALARADSVARADRERDRAARVLDEVRNLSMEEPKNPIPSGLPVADESVIVQALHFDFDKATIRPADLVLLERKLEILLANPRLEVEVAGHCDERGSDEYNLALGERRAATVKRYLIEYGIADRRIRIVSYGEEQPLDAGHDEAAWARNRRADFIVTRPAN